MRAFDLALRLLGAAFAVVMGGLSALLEMFATPLAWPIPVGTALLGNLFLFGYSRVTVGWRWAWLLPAVPWLLVMLVAMASTSEGDQLANSMTGLATFAAGALGFFAPAALPARPRTVGLSDVRPGS